MRTFICGLHPRGSASQSGQLLVGDLLVKVGDFTVWDRCHLNVTTIIKNMSSSDTVTLTVLRNKKNFNDLSVKPVTHYPLLLDDMVQNFFVNCQKKLLKNQNYLFMSLSKNLLKKIFFHVLFIFNSTL